MPDTQIAPTGSIHYRVRPRHGHGSAPASAKRRTKEASVTPLKPRRVRSKRPAKKDDEVPAPTVEPPKLGEQLDRRRPHRRRAARRRAATQQDAGDPRHVGEILVEHEVIKPTDVVDALKAQTEDRPVANESIRVDVGLLDDLMNLVGDWCSLATRSSSTTRASSIPVSPPRSHG
ncbi:MAG: hypothetical protein R2713_10300 [Ilumatobacteraceae bacterium]